ncbi:MAG TPA: hypothetical protein PKE06_24100, partial [Flavilitoribacter sp.]|nr:hypothetical protein [Flavilitoribacter sp.]
MKVRLFLIACFFTMGTGVLSGQPRLMTETGKISFKSDAPLELIEAASNELKGVIDPGRNGFAFSVNIQSFQGFNSPLQREHFNENY